MRSLSRVLGRPPLFGMARMVPLSGKCGFSVYGKMLGYYSCYFEALVDLFSQVSCGCEL